MTNRDRLGCRATVARPAGQTIPGPRRVGKRKPAGARTRDPVDAAAAGTFSRRVGIGWVLGWTCAGLLVGLLLGIAVQCSRGLRPWQNWAAFPMLVLLESPTFIYAGIILGLAGGVLSGREFAEPWSGQIAGWFGLTFADIRHNP